MELYGNKNHQIYLPHPTKHIISCIGEDRFFQNKFWKLFVMFGYEWSDLAVTQKGFSFFNRGSKDRLNWVFEKLDKMGIKYKTSVSGAGWSFYINFSSRKSNLEIIDKEYTKFYRKTKREHKDFFKYENYIVSEAWINDWNNDEHHGAKLGFEKI